MKKIAVIDGNSLVNRAYYAMRNPMITKDGIFTQGIFGFLNMLEKLKRDYEPEYMAVAFDMKAPTFRQDVYKRQVQGRAEGVTGRCRVNSISDTVTAEKHISDIRFAFDRSACRKVQDTSFTGRLYR